MKYQIIASGFIIAAFVLFVLYACYNDFETGSGKYPIRPFEFTRVELKDSFWNQRIKINHEVTIPVALEHSESTGRIRNFEIAGGLADGDFQSDAPFDDSDIYKIIEGASYSLNFFPDPDLESYIDSLVWIIGQAQEDDGYLYTYRTIHGDDSHPWIGSKRWERTHVMSCELYNVGHLYEGAVAHYLHTGKRDLLEIAIKNADLILKDIGPGKFETYPGHQGIEIGLVKLYQVTGKKDYLDLAKYFLDARGHDHIGEPPFWHGEPRTYDQAHKPVIEQTEAVGHAVRALYMYAGMADVATLTGNREYIDAIDRLWEDVTYTKLYITGGVGSQRGHEGFGPAYDLPNMSAYCETCAGIANVFWNHRLFLLHGDAKYIDIMERSLYNNVLSGVSLTGDRFFYPNPLESHGQHQRSEWFGCACCPSNITRFIPSVPGYIYAQNERDVYVNLYVSSITDFDIDGNKVSISQSSEMPWEGNIQIEISPDTPTDFSLFLRIPGWARGEAVPGDLYSIVNYSGNPVFVYVNGEQLPLDLDMGYQIIERIWEAGDVVTIDFPMDINFIESNQAVATNSGKLAIQRGPLVYAAEWPDYEDNTVLDVIINEEMELNPVLLTDDLPADVYMLKGTALGSRILADGSTETYRKPFSAIPYYAWSHRGPGQMMVWMPASKETARPRPAPTIASSSSIIASYPTAALGAVNNRIIPLSPFDVDAGYYHWWPRMNQTEFIVYEFPEPDVVSGAGVYWFDDGPDGGCRVPAGWRILYRKGDKWIPVNNISEYGLKKGEVNRIDFEAVQTDALKLEVRLPENFSSGLYEWEVY